MEEDKDYNESNTIDDFYFHNDGTLAILPEYESNFKIEDKMLLYKQYFGNPSETSYVSLGSVLTCTEGCSLSRLDANEVTQVFVGSNIPVLTCKDRKVGSNIHTFGVCNCKGTGKKCNPVIREDWKQAGNNRVLIYKVSTDEYSDALKSNAIAVCSVGGYIKIAEVNEPEQNTSEEESVVLGSPDYMDELQDFLDNYAAKEGWKYGINASQMGAYQGIMKIIDDVNAYGDTGKIPDDYWLALCKKFNGLVARYGSVYEELHFFRNKLNRAPESLDEMITINKSLISEERQGLF